MYFQRKCCYIKTVFIHLLPQEKFGLSDQIRTSFHIQPQNRRVDCFLPVHQPHEKLSAPSQSSHNNNPGISGYFPFLSVYFAQLRTNWSSPSTRREHTKLLPFSIKMWVWSRICAGEFREKENQISMIYRDL